MSEFTFRRITSDIRTKCLILLWMKDTEVRHRVFARVLEKMGLKGPFKLSSLAGAPKYSQMFWCDTADGKEYIVKLMSSCDTENGIAQIWIWNMDEADKAFHLECGKICSGFNRKK